MKLKIVKYITIITVLFFGFIVTSCKKDEDRTKINLLKKVIENSLGKKVIIPDSLEFYYPFPITKKEINPKFKIFSHIDASCGTCVESLKLWNILIPELNKKNVEVILICTTDDDFELLKYFFESREIKNFSHPLYLDYSNSYLRKNKFMNENKNFETVLTDMDNKIRLIGNPIMSTKMKELYNDKIK